MSRKFQMDAIFPGESRGKYLQIHEDRGTISLHHGGTVLVENVNPVLLIQGILEMTRHSDNKLRDWHTKLMR